MRQAEPKNQLNQRVQHTVEQMCEVDPNNGVYLSTKPFRALKPST